MELDPIHTFGKLQARVLAETLPHLRAYQSKIFVVDYGLRGISNCAAWNSLGRDLALLSPMGLRLVVVLTRDSQGSLVLPDPEAGVIARSAQYLDLSLHGDALDETR